MARAIEIEWSEDALSDLERFAAFLHKRYPHLANIIGREIIERAQLLAESPRLGRPIGGGGIYRQLVLQVRKAPYVFQYRYDGKRLIILRVFHGREARD